jgi:hypothetical protein
MLEVIRCPSERGEESPDSAWVTMSGDLRIERLGRHDVSLYIGGLKDTWIYSQIYK